MMCHWIMSFPTTIRHRIPANRRLGAVNNTLERVIHSSRYRKALCLIKRIISSAVRAISGRRIRIPSHIEYMLLPRLAALSEVLWSAPSRRDWSRFQQKADRMLDRYAALGWNYSESAFTPFIKAQELHPDGYADPGIGDRNGGDYPIHYTLDGTERPRSHLYIIVY